MRAGWVSRARSGALPERPPPPTWLMLRRWLCGAAGSRICEASFTIPTAGSNPSPSATPGAWLWPAPSPRSALGVIPTIVRARRRSAPAPPAAWPVRRSNYLQHLADGVDLQVALGRQTLEASVLGLKFSQAATPRNVRAAMALAPAIVDVLRDAEWPVRPFALHSPAVRGEGTGCRPAVATRNPHASAIGLSWELTVMNHGL